MRPLRESDPPEVGQYGLLAELGRGGMGRVLLGSGPDGRLVAVKLVHEQFAEDDGFRARFRREVDASRAVSGAYTAAVVDADPDAPTPWLASVFVPGPSLHDTIQAVGALPEGAVLRLAAGLATALVHVHRARLVHRDLKPSNVLFAEDGPRVIDFGIARAVDPGRTGGPTRTGSLIGSPAFMSPEQANGETVTSASDVFSLGCVLVAACTGVSPFAGSGTLQTLNNVVRNDPDLAAVPAAILRVVQPCLAKDPADRPTPAQLLDLIGPIAPAARPWPAQVHELIAGRQAEVAELLDRSPGSTASTGAGTPTLIAPRGRTRTKVLFTKVLGPVAGSAWQRTAVVAAVALLLLGAIVALPYLLGEARENASRQPSPTSTSTTPPTTSSAGPSPTPSASPTPTPTARYAAIPDICAKVASRASAIIPDVDGGTEETPVQRFAGLAESHECRWATQGYYSDHPWAADVYVKLFRFPSGNNASAAFEKERTDQFYGNALRLHDFADELCVANPTGEDFGYAHVMFRVDNLLMQVGYQMQTNGSPAPAEARPRGLDMARYVYELVTGAQ
ncbi:MAG: serine/threonine protein kinase [Saccharothrix sp.]|nr:serine/threonine protein kinase [Saccharothrix sp.]